MRLIFVLALIFSTTLAAVVSSFTPYATRVKPASSLEEAQL